MDYNITPYYDDYFASSGGLSKNYYKVLFRPGRALQARELTTAQTILQNQINSFGKYFFPDGADVYGAEKGLETHTYVKLSDASNLATGGLFNNFAVGDILHEYSTNIKAMVTSVCPAETGTGDSPTIWVKYLNANNTVNSWSAGGTLNNGTSNVAVISSASESIGSAEGITVGSGIVFTKNAFVVSNDESIIVKKYKSSSYSKIGYAVKEEIIGVIADTNINEVDVTLCDNAQGYPNYAAPGADRIRYTLYLSSVDVDSTSYVSWSSDSKTYARNTKVIYGDKIYICIKYHTSATINTPGTSGSTGKGYNYWVSIDNFIEIGRIKDSQWIGAANKIGFSKQTYDAVLDVLYKREALTEGNFNVSPHSISIDNTTIGVQLADGTTTTSANDETFIASIGPGYSIVSGKDVNNIHSQRFELNKARTDSHVKTLNNAIIDSTYGSYILAKNINGCFGVDTNETVNFLDSDSNTVASANIKYIGVDPDPSNLKKDNPEYYRFYIYNFKSVANTEPISIKGTSSLATANTEVSYIGRASYDASGNIVTDNPDTVHARIYGSKNKSLLFSTNSNDVKSVHKTNTSSSPLVYALKTYNATLNNVDGTFSVTLSPGDNLKFVDPNNRVDVANKNFVIINSSSFTLNINTGDGYDVVPGAPIPLTAICGESGCTFDVGSDGILTVEFPSKTIQDTCDVKIQAKVGLPTLTADKKTYSQGNISYVKSEASSTNQGYNSSTISFFEPDVNKIIAIYESASSTTDASVPTVTVSGSGPISFIKGETLVEYDDASGIPTGRTAMVLGPTGTTNQWYIVPLEGIDSLSTFFVSGNKINGSTINVSSSTVGDAIRNITNRYTLNTGVTDMMYDWSSINLNVGQIAPKGKLTIIYNKYTVSSPRLNGLFTIDSYGSFVNGPFAPNIEDNTVTYDYVNLPTYSRQLDFRPYRKNLSSLISVSGTIDLSLGEFAYASEYMFNESDIILNVSPFTEDPLQISYDYFVGRTDYAIIDKETNFAIVSGLPGDVEPQQPEGSMLLWKIAVPPYTASVSDIKTTYVENKLYKQKDIAKLDERIKSLEQFAKVTDDELKALSKPEPSMSDLYFGLERFKNGILLDTFTGFDRSDLSDPNFRCSIDSKTQTVRSPFHATSIDVDIPNIVTNIKYHSLYSDESQFSRRNKTGVATINYSTTSFISQPKISSSINVNPYNVFQFMGSISLDPSSDTWYDITTLPDIVVQSPENAAYYNLVQTIDEKLLVKLGSGIAHFKEGDAVRTSLGGSATVGSVDTLNNTITLFNHKGNFGAVIENKLNRADDDINAAGSAIISISLVSGAPGYGTVFGDWNFFWQGYTPQLLNALNTDTQDQIARTTRNLFMRDISTGVRQDLVLKTVDTVTNVKYVDTGIVPYIRSKDIYFEVKGLKPNTVVYPYFDGTKISEYCYQRNNTSEPWTFNSSNTLLTDSSGNVQGKFSLPSGVFRTGEKCFRIIDANLDNFNAASASVSSLADATYTASGTKQTKQSTVLSTRVPEIVTVSLSNERVSTREYIDPLAQTFLVREQEFPAGMYLTSLDLYFASAPTTSGLPVWVEIRNVENGYPSNVIVPGSQVYKKPTEVTVASESNKYSSTEFTFDYPIYLTPGEYAFIVLSNSNEYEIYTAEMGRVDIITNELISAQPYTGSMFKSQNGSTWTAFQEADIAFTLNRAVFSDAASIIFDQDDETLKDLADVGYDSSVDKFYFDICYTLMNFGTDMIVPGNTSLKWEYQTSLKSNGRIGLETSWTEFIPYSDITFDAPRYIRGDNKTIRLRATLSSSDDAVSPLIDLTDQRCILVENLINAPEINSRVHDPALGEHVSTGGHAQAKHISKSVILEEGQDASDIKVYVKGSRRISESSVSNISAFVRIIAQKDNNKEFHNRFWYPMNLVTDPGYSKSETDFLNYSFELPLNIWIVERAFSNTGAIDIYYTGDGRRISSIGSSQTYEYTIDDMSNVLGIGDRIVERLSYDKNTEQLTYYYYDLVYGLNSDLNAYKGKFTTFKQYATKVVMTSSNKALIPVINEVKTLALS